MITSESINLINLVRDIRGEPPPELRSDDKFAREETILEELLLITMKFNFDS